MEREYKKIPLESSGVGELIKIYFAGANRGQFSSHFSFNR